MLNIEKPSSDYALNDIAVKEEKSFWQTYLSMIAAFIIYSSTIIITYICYDNEFKNRKSEILDEYYNMIFNHNLITLRELLQQLPLDPGGVNTIISIEQSDIKSCYNEQCIRSDLFKFISLFDKYIPDFIYYKIEVNKELLHVNNKIGNYEIEKTHYINNYNQLTISLSADSKYLESIKQRTLKSFFISFSSSTFFLILFILSNQVVNKRFKSLYKNWYELNLKKVREFYRQELALKENGLMRKIWNLEYSKEKEIEFNYLFSQEASKLAMIIQKIEYVNFDTKTKFLPCISLYRSTEELENINVKDLIEIFTSRFSAINDNISLHVQSSDQNIAFVSKASLYQIIYSIISYIVFILREQAYNKKHEIRLIINSIEKAIQLRFKYDGFPITGEQELFKMSNGFFKTYANPFLLDINQVFNVLRTNGFDCNVSHNQFNVIEIVQKTQPSYKQKADNIVLLSSFIKEKK
jgi:hypothetical protein